ncbi:MAG TPA: hypothetical protein VGL93_10915 [Streptosporangiaceae bacterium]
MNEKRDAPDPVPDNALDRIAATLDAAGVDLGILRRDFPQWRVWYSDVTGACHAMRDGGFQERESDGRRYHVAASTPARLAVLLLAQAAADAEMESGET